MNPTMYISLGMLWVMIFIMIARQKQQSIIRSIIKNKKSNKEKHTMKLLAQKFVDKDVLVYSLNSQISGKILEVSDGAILLDNGKNVEAINIDYIIRIREYPTNKNGKKKSVVLD